MNWEEILKNKRSIDRRAKKVAGDKSQTRLDLGIPVPKEMRDKKVIKPRKQTRSKTDKPRIPERDVGSADASDVLPPLSELRAEMVKDPRGLYGDLSDKIFRLASLARKEPRRQKVILGHIRKLIRKANISERNL
tara:strand:+ start:512 stop:916 length:405 start_codon:yes stop_codon:yes gene_type:complete